jgi:hypothetical protein
VSGGNARAGVTQVDGRVGVTVAQVQAEVGVEVDAEGMVDDDR